MRRMGRFLINVATAVSLLLLAITVVVWVGTFEERQEWWWSDSAGQLVRDRQCTAHRGNFLLTVLNTKRRAPCTGCSIDWHWRVIALQRFDYPPGHQWSFYVHALVLCVVFASLPAGRVVVKVIRRCFPRPRGFCAVCGYDLRATPERCPECGAVPGSLEADGE